jgi:hypothetical protein
MWQTILTAVVAALGTNAFVLFIAKKWVERKFAKALAGGSPPDSLPNRQAPLRSPRPALA